MSDCQRRAHLIDQPFMHVRVSVYILSDQRLPTVHGQSLPIT